jgi:hypothetical protein
MLKEIRAMGPNGFAVRDCGPTVLELVQKRAATAAGPFCTHRSANLPSPLVAHRREMTTPRSTPAPDHGIPLPALPRRTLLCLPTSLA